MNSFSSRSSTTSTEAAFGRLWLARDVAALADWIFFVGMLTYVAMFSDSPETIGMLVAIMLAPRLVVWPFATRLVTRRNAAIFGIAAQVVRAAVVIPGFLLDRESGAQPILVMALAYAVAGPFAGSAFRALFPETADDAQRGSVRNALQDTWLLTLAVGPAFGYLIYGVTGLRSTAAATTAGLLISAALLLFSRHSSTGDRVKIAQPEVLVGVVPLPLGVAEALRDTRLQQIAATQAIAALLAGGVVVLEAAYTTNGLFVGIENFGLLLAGQGAGIALAGVWQRRAPRYFAFGTIVSTGLALIGAGELGLAVSTSLPAGIGLAAVIGAGIGLLISGMADLARQVAATRQVREPALGVRAVVDGAVLISAAIAAPLARSLSPRFTLVIAATLTWVLALYTFGALPQFIDESEASDSRSNA